MPKAIIEIEEVGKRYRIAGPQERYLSLRDEVAKRLSSARRRAHPPKEDFWALKDVSFTVNEGEAVGIVGRNGAGKSTLLKILSQITPPTTGRVTMRGRVASLLEVGTGFHPELTGRENIYLNGAILGMTRREIARKFDEIVDFAEVERFLDTPVKRYSSGMYVRLAFAVAAHLEPEILVVDEVLAVGDTQFQAKCLGKMGSVATSGRTVLFVSHNMAAVRTLCSTVALLESGACTAYGPSESVLRTYKQRHIAVDDGVWVAESASKREACVASVRVVPSDEVRCLGSRLEVEMEVRCGADRRMLQLSVIVATESGTRVLHLMSRDEDFYFDCRAGLTTVRMAIDCLSLYPGRYLLEEVWLATRDGMTLDVATNTASFEVHQGSPVVARELSQAKGLVFAHAHWGSRFVPTARSQAEASAHRGL